MTPLQLLALLLALSVALHIGSVTAFAAWRSGTTPAKAILLPSRHGMVVMAEAENRLNDDWQPPYGLRSAGAVGQAIVGNAAVCPPAVNVIAAGRWAQKGQTSMRWSPCSPIRMRSHTSVLVMGTRSTPAAVTRVRVLPLGSATVRGSLRRTGQMGSPW